MVTHIPSAFQEILVQFACVFTAPSYDNFVTLVTGWILCTGRHTVSRVIQFAARPGATKHFSTLYRFFSRAVWNLDTLGRVLVKLVLALIPGAIVFASVDDTLCRKSGPHLWGAGMHYDPLRSTYGRGTPAGRKSFLAFGHSWVILSLWVPLPWNPQRGLALPVLFRLYRSKKRCPKGQYRKRTQLAAEMVAQLIDSLGADRHLVLLGDNEYACETLVKPLPASVDFVGPMGMNAALYDLPGPYSGRGCPRKKGRRLPSPQQLAKEPSVPWEPTTLAIYGRQVQALVKTQVCLWYRVAGTRPVRMMVVRDPKGNIDDRAYFVTNPDWTPQEIAVGFARRWPQEQMHRDTKQLLGLEDPQNGWWRRPHGKERPPKRPGPQPHPTRGKPAAERTVPIALTAYTIVVVWYLQHGTAEVEVMRARAQAPWYRHKAEPSFADMLSAARIALWRVRLFANPVLKAASSKIIELFPSWLLAA